MKKKEKNTIIFLVVSLMTALVLITLLVLKKQDKSGSEKKADTGPTVESTADAATTSDAETTSDTEKTTDNEKETTTETPTTAEEETTENPDMLRDNKYNQIAINAKENGQKIVYLTFDDGSGTLTPAYLIHLINMVLRQLSLLLLNIPLVRILPRNNIMPFLQKTIHLEYIPIPTQERIYISPLMLLKKILTAYIIMYMN